jgi:phosphoribosylanthranilate isomerase
MTLVKICGIINASDGLKALNAGADLLGFIFYSRSPRHVTCERACDISNALRQANGDRNLFTVGVFVNEPLEEVVRSMRLCNLDFAQLHGTESPEYVKALRDRGISAFKALRIASAADLSPIAAYDCAAFVLDTYIPGQLGGTGIAFDWSLAISAKHHGRVILAGGLNPDNVAEAVRTVRPWGVDVSSGVEMAPGKKDADKMARFVRRAKSAHENAVNDKHRGGER